MIYGVILAIIAAVILLILTALFVCSLFPKGRRFFDEGFKYSDIQLISIHTRLDSLEKDVQNVKESLEELKHVKEGKPKGAGKETKKNSRA